MQPFKERVDNATAEIKVILGKYSLGLAAEPAFVRTEGGAFKIAAKPIYFNNEPKTPETETSGV